MARMDLAYNFPESEYYDDLNTRFITLPPVRLHFEHSLYTISLWESITKKPFFPKSEKEVMTDEQLLIYIQCSVVEEIEDSKEILYRLNEDFLNAFKNFIEDTMNADMSKQYQLFEKYLNSNNLTILDLGFGSGRDSLYFQNKGYDVYSLDPIKEFCEHAKELGLKHVYQKSVEEMEFVDKFDGIWACASLLHIPYNELTNVFNKCYEALKKDGIMYCSFKYGEFEGERNGRFFTDLNDEKLNDLIKNTRFKILELSITDDVRVDRNDKWINIILKK